MRIKLSYKIFATLTLTSLLVVVLMVGLIRYYVALNFTDYVNRTLLERYSEIADALAAEYQTHRSWQVFKAYPGRWQDILRTSLPHRDFDSGYRPAQPPDSEKKGFSGRAQDRPSPGASRRIQRLARRLALFDADKQIIAGGRTRVEYAGYTLQAIVVDGQTVGWLGLYKKEQLADPLVVGFLTQQSQMLYIIGIGILLLAALVAFLLSRHLLAPVEKLTAGTQALMSRRFDTRIEVESKDELGQLAADFNTMAQTLESYEQMRQQWISDIAHELRTPLSILRGEIEALQDGVREINRNTLNSLYTEAKHLSKIVNDLHELSLADTGVLSIKKVPVDPAAILSETLGHFAQSFAENHITIENNLGNHPPITILGDADRLRQLFSNLVENALRYADAPGVLTIEQARTADRLLLSFEDSGPGVPEDALAHLFDRLYRVDRSRTRTHGGSGLGLSICKSFVNALGGEIRAANGNLGGLRIEVDFPLTG
ncbi:MAG: HAMP domain-containing protein [Deltaproteobacteria bacterium]|jgi:two-component system sensor histidine kinase BaeS|nr:HAMP domain-containing protein [Deltaproteobacteria bacterium]